MTIEVKEITRYKDGNTIIYQDQVGRKYWYWIPTKKLYTEKPFPNGSKENLYIARPSATVVDIWPEVVTEFSKKESEESLIYKGKLWNELLKDRLQIKDAAEKISAIRMDLHTLTRIYDDLFLSRSSAYYLVDPSEGNQRYYIDASVQYARNRNDLNNLLNKYFGETNRITGEKDFIYFEPKTKLGLLIKHIINELMKLDVIDPDPGYKLAAEELSKIINKHYI